MKFSRVHLESLGYTLPDESVSSNEIEQRLAPLYQRLRLPPGRLELMTGIGARRFFPPGTRPSDVSIQSCEDAIAKSGIDRGEIGVLIHGSVCRDFLEPATACRVHHALGLRQDCLAFDVSNACLGVLTGAMQIASMIELGQVCAGLVVGTEIGRPLVENTIARLNTDESLTRNNIKLSVASLTIGSASAAMLLCDADLATNPDRISAATALAVTEHNELCQSEGLHEVMHTDSERLMHAGIAAGAATFDRFLTELGCHAQDLDKTVCHQVGAAHRRMMLDRLGVDEPRDYATLDWLGNTGSAALPVSYALAEENGHTTVGDRVGLLGIGSGVNCLMMAVEKG